MAKEKEKEKAKNASAGSSRPPPGSVTQQFGGATEAQPSSSELHAAAPTPPTTSGVASVATTRWTRFWLTACYILIEQCTANSFYFLPGTRLVSSYFHYCLLRHGTYRSCITFWPVTCCTSAQYTDGHHQ
ncbi:hypothetical protein K503DRAFT_782497 [Rhizopogon vinicolor AM-OR11-026]|uniref:Uncharacterized protein n=1 Tax=Rhizopogon vinicolor AM-OR11-026 TaxID=1314800 RepID=A0A1B7N262_9AGAM|nr:hypothetical protein K503DRAFT_782497 [Rhizopogon vinicolor AM-OR11-026]